MGSFRENVQKALNHLCGSASSPWGVLQV
jgi:hypothetical protein